MPEFKTTLTYKCRNCGAEFNEQMKYGPCEVATNFGKITEAHLCDPSNRALYGVAELIRAEKKEG